MTDEIKKVTIIKPDTVERETNNCYTNKSACKRKKVLMLTVK